MRGISNNRVTAIGHSIFHSIDANQHAVVAAVQNGIISSQLLKSVRFGV